MMRTYRVGIIGCGPRAESHAEALRQMPEVEIAGAADVQPERLNAFCDRWKIENRYASSTQLLESQKLDLVTIVTLPGPRPDLVCECARAGVPVINAEKVAAYDLAAMDRMLDACAASGSLLTINHQMRFMPQFKAVRELITAGRLGEIKSLRAGSRGNLTEQGTHMMDQMLFMNNDSPAVWVLGQCEGVEGYDRGHTAPSSAVASMEFANGVRGTLECGMLAPEVDPAGGFWLQKHIEVTGTKGWAGAYVNNGWRAVLEGGELLSGPGTWEPNWPAEAALFRAGLDWIDDPSREHPCRGELARRGLEALFAICQSSIDRAAVAPPLGRERDVLTELKSLLGAAHRLHS
jgi:predicted dehydrogenase